MFLDMLGKKKNNCDKREQNNTSLQPATQKERDTGGRKTTATFLDKQATKRSTQDSIFIAMKIIFAPVVKQAVAIFLLFLGFCRCSVVMALSSPTTTTSPTTSFSSSSVGPQVLKNLVQQASRMQENGAVDLNGVVWLEHINLVVGPQTTAELFYQDFLGFTRDPNAKFHVNLGQQQFHLAEFNGKNSDGIQKIAGSVGLVVPDLQTVRNRLDKMNQKLMSIQQEQTDPPQKKEGLFQIRPEDSDGCMTVSCPWGNTYHLYCAKHDTENLVPKSTSTQKMVKLHSQGGTYATERMTVRGQPGIRYIELTCPQGTIPAIAKFYEEMVGCITTTQQLNNDESTNTKALAVSVGPGVHLLFVESSTSSSMEQDHEDMKGVHICIYTPNFQELYNKLASRNLIWTNPRFTHLDSCDTWEEAVASRTLRFKDIIDLDTGDKIMELEHETRPLRHGQYMKVPHYVPK